MPVAQNDITCPHKLSGHNYVIFRFCAERFAVVLSFITISTYHLLQFDLDVIAKIVKIVPKVEKMNISDIAR